MTGYWLILFFCVFIDQDKVEVHKTPKKEQGYHPVSVTPQLAINTCVFCLSPH